MSISTQELGDLRERSGQKRIQKSDLLLGNMICFPENSPTPEPGKRRSKYNAVRSVDSMGRRWDSKAEERRFHHLLLLEKNGNINQLERQPEFWIAINGIKCGKYIADFKYCDCVSGECFYEDVKGMKTPLYKFKKRCVEALYGITITEITR